MRKYFLITIDTEPDNLWARREYHATRNARYLPRFQRLCDQHALKPVYLTDYQMALDEFFVEFAKEVLKGQRAEIGMHLHAWNTPGGGPLGGQDHISHPYLINYSMQVMREKITIMTDILGEQFGVAPVSHRAGRWAFDVRYANILSDLGYRVDCSVTPNVVWPALISEDGLWRGADYRDFPTIAYRMSPHNIAHPAKLGLMQVPVTTRIRRNRWDDYLRPLFAPFVSPQRFTRFGIRTEWLRPNGRNLDEMKKLLESVATGPTNYAEFILHSSEFMPGGSPTFQDEPSIDRLYEDLEELFRHSVQLGFRGATLAEYERIMAKEVGQSGC